MEPKRAVTSATIDITRLNPLLKSVGWSIAEAEAAFKADFSQPVTVDLKRQIQQTIETAKRFKMFYPQTKVTGMRYITPGNGGGNRKPGTGTGG